RAGATVAPDRASSTGGPLWNWAPSRAQDQRLCLPLLVRIACMGQRIGLSSESLGPTKTRLSSIGPGDLWADLDHLGRRLESPLGRLGAFGFGGHPHEHPLEAGRG